MKDTAFQVLLGKSLGVAMERALEVLLASDVTYHVAPSGASVSEPSDGSAGAPFTDLTQAVQAAGRHVYRGHASITILFLDGDHQVGDAVLEDLAPHVTLASASGNPDAARLHGSLTCRRGQGFHVKDLTLHSQGVRSRGGALTFEDTQGKTTHCVLHTEASEPESAALAAKGGSVHAEDVRLSGAPIGCLADGGANLTVLSAHPADQGVHHSAAATRGASVTWHGEPVPAGSGEHFLNLGGKFQVE
jgi:hypothetical protein